MAGNPLTRVTRGIPLSQGFSAEWFNLVCAAVEDYLDRRGGKVGAANLERLATYEHGLVKNNSGEDRDRFEILGIEDSFLVTPDDNLDDFQGNPVLLGVTPTEEHAGKFVILQEAIPNGEIGRCIITGASIVQIDVANEGHGFADITDGESGYLTSDTSGLCRIIQKESGTGQKWALVAYGGGGGECDCPNYWYQITYTGQATSSTFQLIITITGASGSPWTLNVPYNQSPSGLQTQIEAVGPFASTPADYKVAVHSDDDGSLPGNTLNLTFSIPSSETLSARRGTNSSNAFVFVANMKKPEV